jgi:hypothetical protein
MSDFKKQMPLREALGKLGVRMVLENDAFKSGPVAGDRVLDVMVAFPADGDFTVARFLEIALKQVPEAEATFVVHADCIEITSQQRAAMLRSLLRQREMQAHAPPNRVMK